MNKYIAVLGLVDEITKEISVTAKDHYEAHKTALFKCNLGNKETVFKIKEATTSLVKFDHKTGFIS